MSDDPKANANLKPGETPGRLRPTIIAAPAKRAKNQKDIAPPSGAPSPRASTPIVSKPTVIRGVERKRIAVSAADMARLSPGVAPRTAARAVKLIDGFVAEAAQDQHVALWGHAAQKSGAALVSDALDLSQADVLGRTRGYIGRAVELLGMIDIETICDLGPSLVLGVQEATAKPVDTPRKLAAARAELDHLVRLTEAALAPLQQLKGALDDHSRRIDEASLEIEAAALAALFLSEHLALPRPELSRRFLQREMSLTQTVVEIRGSQFERDRQAEEPLALIAAIQDVVLVAMPDWLDRMAILTRARTARLNPTEAGELQRRLRAILRQLKA